MEAIGPEVTSVAPGDHVITCLTQYCGTCAECHAGRIYVCPNRQGLGRGSDREPTLSLDGTPVLAMAGLEGHRSLGWDDAGTIAVGQRADLVAVALDEDQQTRFQRLVEQTTMIDLHQHPMVKPEDPSRFIEYLRGGAYAWGYEAVRHGGFSAVGTANVFGGMVNTDEMSFIRFEDLLDWAHAVGCRCSRERCKSQQRR